MSMDQPVDVDFSRAVRAHADGSLVDVWAVPGASRIEIAGLHDGAVRIRVAASPEGGKANRAIERLLVAVAGSEVELVRGHRSRRKRFRVNEVSPEVLVRLIARQTG